MMDAGSPLDTLVFGLSMDERQELLQKLTIRSHISQELLYSEDQTDNGTNIREQFNRLSLLARLWLSFLSVINGKPADKLYEDRKIAETGRQIERAAPGTYDFKKDRLLTAFRDYLEKLKDAARFFHTALDAGFNRDRKSFYGFLGSLEMAALHLRIQDETMPDALENQFPGSSGAELHKKAVQVMENMLGSISEENRAVMYSDSRTLFCLKELAAFPFDRILRQFDPDLATGRMCCPVNAVRDQLAALSNILFSMKLIPPMPLLGSMFVFLLKTQQRGEEPNNDAELEQLMGRAAECLETIRTFNRVIPLTLILRCSMRNMQANPREISGGEDWLSLYREYWKRTIDETFSGHAKGHREQKLREIFGILLHGLTFKPMDDAASAENPNGFPFKGAWALAFLGAFYSAVFIPEMNEALNLLFVEGSFVLKEDAVNFTESYTAFYNLELNIRKFKNDISAIGNFGRRFQQINLELNSQPAVKRHRLEAVSNEASGVALGIVRAIHQASRLMAVLLKKVTTADTTGRYVALGNMAALTAKYPDFLPALTGMPEQFTMLAQALEDVDIFEQED
jgi:hypothetical protein